MKKLRFSRSRSALRCKRKRRFGKYAKPFQFKKYNAMTMGENVQIDHMTVTKNGVVMKHFAGIERISEHVYANVYSKANRTKMYRIKFTQFRSMNASLSPKKPTYNGKIEQSNRIFREEFYADLSENTIVEARRELMNFMRKYNTHRPHAS